METWAQLLVAVLVGLAASSGFWSYIQRKSDNKSATTRLLMGLAYDKIVTLGMQHIERGWITKDDYEDLRKYFWEPYQEFGGNGTAEKIMTEVGRLPIRSRSLYTEMIAATVSWKEDEQND